MASWFPVDVSNRFPQSVQKTRDPIADIFSNCEETFRLLWVGGFFLLRQGATTVGARFLYAQARKSLFYTKDGLLCKIIDQLFIHIFGLKLKSLFFVLLKYKFYKDLFYIF